MSDTTFSIIDIPNDNKAPIKNCELSLVQAKNLFELRMQHALFLKQQGFFLLPLKPGTKVPEPVLLPTDKTGHATWKPLSKIAASDTNIIAWFNKKPDINIGIICGSVSNLYVLDVDGKMSKGIGTLPPTVVVKTNRGWHYYYKSEKKIETYTLGNWGSIQGENAYVVAAGCLHPMGNLYEYADTLSITETEIAKLPDWLEAPTNRPKKVSPLLTNSKRHTNNTVSMPKAKFSDYEKLNQDPTIAFKLMALCGRTVTQIGKAFCCPIPGHSEKNPSTSLWQEPGRPIVLHDFHKIDKNREWWPLVDVYASYKAGKPLHLHRGERVVWWLRALNEIGEINPPKLKRYELPVETKMEAKKVYEGFIYLLELQQLYQQKYIAPFNRTFASNWCGIDVVEIRRGMTWLLQKGYLYIAQRGRPNKNPKGPSPTFFAIGRPKTI